MELCRVCSRVPFSDLFGISREPQYWEICGLEHAHAHRLKCRFCSFLVNAYELAYNLPRGQRAPNNKDVQFAFLSVLRVDQNENDGAEPWFESLGISIEHAHVGPALWLQFHKVEKDRHKVQLPLVCVSCTPAEQQPGQSFSYLPRQRNDAEDLDHMINYGIIEEWLKICTETHDGLCRSQKLFQRRLLHSRLQFRLIDVLRRESVVVDEDSAQYVALSYVWGAVMKKECTCFWSKADSKMTRIQLPQSLPQTIEDAISFTKTINHRYLWVDAYCIDQSDQEDLCAQIENMDLVFDCAYLTIAALDGQDGDAGLPGISRQFNQHWQPRVKIPYGDFVATYVDEIWSFEDKSYWESRAWTLQELLLSKRILFFTKYHISLRCNTEFFHDLLDVRRRSSQLRYRQSFTYFWENGFDVRLNDQDWSFLQYDILLANYSRRHMEHQDILSACKGALKKITTNTGVGFVHGLPRASLHRALLWKPHHDNVLTRRSGFPSWSWTGWVGRIEHHYCLADLDLYEEFGVQDREILLKQEKREFSPEEEKVIKNSAAVISVADDTLEIVSDTAPTTAIWVRQKGDASHKQAQNSEQADIALGDQWVLLNKYGDPLANKVGEVARFEDVDYSIQVHPTVSAEIEDRYGRCELVLIRYFPSLCDQFGKGEPTWLFDYVGCLVVIKSGKAYARVGFVFISVAEWASFDRRIKVTKVV